MEVHLKELFTRFNEQFTSGPSLGPTSNTCLLQIQNIPTSFIKSLLRAAAALHRSEPWRRIRPPHLLGVRVGKDFDWPGKKQPFSCAQFIGADGGDLGLHLFRSPADAQKMSSLREKSVLFDVELLRVMFMHESLLLPSARRMIRGLEMDGGDRFAVIDVVRCGCKGNCFRNPTAEELRFVFGFLKAVVIVHPFLRFDGDEVKGKVGLMGFEPFVETVDVEWPGEVPRAGELVAVTICYPSGEMCQQKKMSSQGSVEAAKIVEAEEEGVM